MDLGSCKKWQKKKEGNMRKAFEDTTSFTLFLSGAIESIPSMTIIEGTFFSSSRNEE